MNRQKFIAIFIILLFLLDLTVVLFKIGGTNLDPIRNALLVVGQITTIVGGIYTVNKYGRKNKTGKTILLFTLGLAFWMLGGIIFAVNDFFRGQAEFPSMADVSIFIGYALLLTSLIHEIKSRSVKLTRIHKFFLFLVGALTTVVVFYFNVFLIFDPTTPLLVTIATIIYSLADILLVTTLILVLILANDYSGGKLFYPWFYIFLGVMCMLVGDGLFSIFIEDYLNKSGIYLIIDLIWRLAYVFFAIGLFKLGFIITNIQKQVLTNSQFIKPKKDS